MIGRLTADGLIGVSRMRELIAIARPMAVTSHRAFDMTPDSFAAIETLTELGLDWVLTSGQEASVLEGLPLIAELVTCAGERTIAMRVGGTTSRNVERIVSAARPKEIHFAALEMVQGGGRFRRDHVLMGGELRPPDTTGW